MKNILGHKSWSEAEILAFFDNGSFTMCKLPHRRFQRVQMVCGNLKRCGLIEKVGSTETGVNYIATPAYHQWRRDVGAGTATPSLTKLYKLKNPPKLHRKHCRHCKGEYEAYNFAQKYCTGACGHAAKQKPYTLAKMPAEGVA